MRTDGGNIGGEAVFPHGMVGDRCEHTVTLCTAVGQRYHKYTPNKNQKLPKVNSQPQTIELGPRPPSSPYPSPHQVPLLSVFEP
jgi:hypothetical protein